jgi:hypothetical protein
MTTSQLRPPTEKESQDDETQQRSAFWLIGTVVGIMVSAYFIVDPLLIGSTSKASSTSSLKPSRLPRALRSPCGSSCLGSAAQRCREGTIGDPSTKGSVASRGRTAGLRCPCASSDGDGCTEDLAHLAVARALERGTSRLAAELLLADSSEAHLKRVAHAAPDGSVPGCPVTTPGGCPAIDGAKPSSSLPEKRSMRVGGHDLRPIWRVLGRALPDESG